MGLFAQQPEEPTDWTGLPGEPLRPVSEAEILPEGPRWDAELLGTEGSPVTFIEIPVTVEPPADPDAD